MFSRRRLIAAFLGALVLAGAAAALVLRPDAARDARLLAAALGDAFGRPVRVEGVPAYAVAWPLRLAIPAVAVDGVGRISGIVVAEGRLAARAELFGRSGEFTRAADGAARFAAPGMVASFDPASGRARLETRFAGAPLVLAGRPDAGGLDALEIAWAGRVLRGRARPADVPGRFAVAAAETDGVALEALFDVRDATLEGTLAGALDGLGALAAEFRADPDLLDVARFALAGGPVPAEGALRREAGRTSLDLRLGRVALAELVVRAAPFAGAASGDFDLRLRATALAWPSGEAQGIVLVAAREAGRLVVDELAVRAIGDASLRLADGMLDLQAPDARRFFAALGLRVERHLGALSLRGRAVPDLDAASLRLAPIELSLAGQRLTGALDWTGGKLAADLAGDRVSLDPFFGPPPVPPPVRGPLLTRREAARAAAAAAPPPPGPGGWSRAPLRLDLAGGVPFDLKLAARELAFAGNALGDARLSLVADGTALAVDELAGALHGGALKLRGRATGGAATGFDAEFALENAEAARLLAAFGAPPALRGPLTLAGRLAARGADAAALAGGLAGTLRVSSPGGTLDGIDLPGLFAHARVARNADLVELGRRFARGGRSAYASAQGNWTVEGGRARTTDTRLAAGDGAVELAGLVDLAAWNVDLVLRLLASGAAIEPRVTLAGALARPRVGLVAAPSAATGAGPPAGSAAPGRRTAPDRAPAR
jgi:hypothetical protein